LNQKNHSLFIWGCGFIALRAIQNSKFKIQKDGYWIIEILSPKQNQTWGDIWMVETSIGVLSP